MFSFSAIVAAMLTFNVGAFFTSILDALLHLTR